MVRMAWPGWWLGLMIGAGPPVAAQVRDSVPAVELKENYPNPFYPSTTIPFEIHPEVCSRGNRPLVRLEVLNVIAQVVAVPVIQVKALYFRNDPILCGFPLLKPSSGDNLHFSLMRSSLIWNALDEAGVPDVKGVWCHPAGGRFLTVVSITQRYPGHARQAGMIASQCRSGAYLGRYVVVVDDDVDITNSEEFLWALSSRSDPAESIEILRRAWSGPLDPRIARDQVGHSSRAVIDATRPYEWREKFPKVSGASRELKEKVAGNWREFLDEKVDRY